MQHTSPSCEALVLGSLPHGSSGTGLGIVGVCNLHTMHACPTLSGLHESCTELDLKVTWMQQSMCIGLMAHHMGCLLGTVAVGGCRCSPADHMVCHGSITLHEILMQPCAIRRQHPVLLHASLCYGAAAQCCRSRMSCVADCTRWIAARVLGLYGSEGDGCVAISGLRGSPAVHENGSLDAAVLCTAWG